MSSIEYLQSFCNNPASKAADIVSWYHNTFGDTQADFLRYIHRLMDLRGVPILSSEIAEEAKNKRKSLYYGTQIIADKLATHGGGIHFDDGHIYAYNGKFWQILNETQYIDLLLRVVSETGINPLIYSEQRIRDRLFEFVFIYPFSGNTVGKINIRNKILIIDEDTGDISFEPKTCKYFFRYEMPCRYYDEPPQSLYFENFIKNAMSDESQRLLQKFIGSCFLINSKYRFEKALYIYGRGGTGKTTLLNCITHVLGGSHNVSSASIEQITKDPTVIKSVYKKMLNISSETKIRDADQEMLKKMISNEPIEFRGAYDRKTSITDSFPRIIMTSNHLVPQFENDNSMQRRLLFIAMNNPVSKIDITLQNKILEHDCDFMLWWIIHGIAACITEGITMTNETIEMIKIAEENNSFNIFLSNKWDDIRLYGIMPITDFYNKYHDYCKINNLMPKSRQKIVEEALNCGFESKIAKYEGKTTRCFVIDGNKVKLT